MLLVYDLTNRNSFLNLTDWLQDVKRNLDHRNAVFVCVATKSDLNKLRQVKTEEGKQFAKMHNMSFKETSAKMNLNGKWHTSIWLQALAIGLIQNQIKIRSLSGKMPLTFLIFLRSQPHAFTVDEVFTMIAEQIYDKVENGEFPIEEYKPAITRFNFPSSSPIHFPLKRLRSVDDQSNRCRC